MKIMLSPGIKYFEHKILLEPSDLDNDKISKCFILNKYTGRKTNPNVLDDYYFLPSSEFDSLEIFMDVLKLGSFIEKNLEPLPNKDFLKNLIEYNRYGFLCVEEVYKKKEKEFCREIDSFYEKYGFTLPEYSHLNFFCFEDFIPYLQKVEITEILSGTHYIAQIHSIIIALKKGKEIDLKLFKSKNENEEKIKEHLADAICSLGKYKVFTHYDKENQNYIHMPIFSSVIDVCYKEIRQMLTTTNSDNFNEHIGFCANCNNLTVLSHKSQKYCKDDECKKSQDRERKRRSDELKKLKKRKEKNNGSISKKEKHVAN